MQDHTVQAKDRQIAFTGELLSSASSQSPGKDRWSEINIYRTEAGKYVVAGVGRSIRAGEDDRYWAHVSGTPEGIIEVLYLYDGDEVRYMPWTSRRALEDASKRDTGLHVALKNLVEHVA